VGERVDGEAAEPLPFSQHPVVVAGGQESAAVVAHRRRWVAAAEGVGESDHIDPDRATGVPPDGLTAELDEVVRIRER